MHARRIDGKRDGGAHARALQSAAEAHLDAAGAPSAVLPAGAGGDSSETRQNEVVPKITAPTVAENRELRRNALLEAAATLIERTGSARLSVAEIASEVGLSRSAVYEYYRSSADLVADVLVDELLTWTELIVAAVEGAPDPQAKVAAWISTNLDYAAHGRHALVRAAGQIELPPTRRAQIGTLHHDLVAPLREAVVASGQDPVVVSYIWGVTQAAIERIEAGADPILEAASAISFCTRS